MKKSKQSFTCNYVIKEPLRYSSRHRDPQAGVVRHPRVTRNHVTNDLCLCVSFRRSVAPAVFVLCLLPQGPTAVCVILTLISSLVPGCQVSRTCHHLQSLPQSYLNHCSLLNQHTLASAQQLKSLSTAEWPTDTILQVLLQGCNTLTISVIFASFQNQYHKEMKSKIKKNTDRNKGTV